MNEDEAVEYIAKKAVLWSLIYGSGLVEGLPTKDKFMQNYWDAVPNALDSRKLGTFTLDAEQPTALPPKICTYRKPKLYWFGEVHGSNNFIWDEGYTMGRHWSVIGDTVEEYNPLKGRRFISEPEEQNWDNVDNEFLKKLTGDEWVETKTCDKKSSEWKPQGKIIVMSGKPLRMNNKDKETIERVEGIEYPEA